MIEQIKKIVQDCEDKEITEGELMRALLHVVQTYLYEQENGK